MSGWFPDLGPHAPFIIASYLGAALTVAALIGLVWRDKRQTDKRLARLEAQGLRRRSDGR